jgi:outer membrane protein TolC
MKRHFLLILFLMILSSSAGAVSIEEAVRTGLKNNHLLKVQKARQNEAGARLKARKGLYFPSIGIKGTYTIIDAPIEMDLNGIREAMILLDAKNQTEIANLRHLIDTGEELTTAEKLAVGAAAAEALNLLLPDFKQTIFEKNLFRVAVSVEQPIFIGGKIIAANKAAKNELRLEDEHTVSERLRIIREIKGSYLLCQMLKQVTEVRLGALEVVKENVKRAEKAFKEGLISKPEVLTARAALAEAEAEAQESVNQQNLALAGLAHNLGLESITAGEVDDLLKPESAPVPYDTLLLYATSRASVVRELEVKNDLADNLMSVNRAGYLPEVGAYGFYQLDQHALSIFEPKWAAGLLFKWNLFRGFRDKNKVEIAHYKKIQAEEGLKYARSGMKTYARKLWMEYQNNKLYAEKLAAVSRAAKANYDLRMKSFQNQMVTYMEVDEARVKYLAAEVKRLNAIYKMNLAVYDMERLINLDKTKMEINDAE